MPGARLLRRDESILLVAIVALLIAGIASLVVLPNKERRVFAPEAGALLAPPSDQSLSASQAAPAAPADAAVTEQPAAGAGSAGGTTNSPGHGAPAPQPGPTAQPTPPNGGLLHDLPLPPLPPPPRVLRAAFRVLIVRGVL